MEAHGGTIIDGGFGGPRTVVERGKCSLCRRRVYGWKEENGSADPRGYFGPRNTVTDLEACQFDNPDTGGVYFGPDVLFCWDCLNEHGREGYDKCLAVAVALWSRFQDGCDGYHRPFCPPNTLAARLDMGGGSGLYICREHWRAEMAFRRDRNKELDPSVRFEIRDFPTPQYPHGKVVR